MIMNYRFKFSILLVFCGLVLILMPSVQFSLSELNPNQLLKKSLNKDQYFSVDQVARFIVYEDTAKLFIDLRTPEEYKEFNIPGSINIPYSDLLNPDWQGYLNQDKVQNVFYSNGDIISTSAWMLTSRLGYKNNYIMKGGINEWYKTVMESKFKGGKISAKENALFESRFKAKKLFTELNSLPDSLKTRFIEAKRLEESELDGGCN
jgi:rhodanese-related sulfurtransferase